MNKCLLMLLHPGVDTIADVAWNCEKDFFMLQQSLAPTGKLADVKGLANRSSRGSRGSRASERWESTEKPFASEASTSTNAVQWWKRLDSMRSATSLGSSSPKQSRKKCVLEMVSVDKSSSKGGDINVGGS